MRSIHRGGARSTLLLFTLLLSWLAPRPAPAQQIVVSSLDASAFQIIRAEVDIVDRNGDRITDLLPGDFIVTENGERRQVISFTCPPPPGENVIASVLAIDVSGSMSRPGQGGGTPNIDLAQAAANAWIDGLPMNGSSCALTTFDHRGRIMTDFTSDRDQLRQGVAGLRPGGGTDYDAGLLNPPDGALPIVEAGNGRHVIVFLTDGRGLGDEEAIVARAEELNAVIYCVTLGMSAPPIVKNIAARTGGLCYENVTTIEAAQAIYRAILHRALGGGRCELAWLSAGSCRGERLVGIAVPGRNLQGTTRYFVPPERSPGLAIDPPILYFGDIPPGESSQMRASISAVNGPITIIGIDPSIRSSAMTLDGLEFPAILLSGESRTVTVRYRPVDGKEASVRWSFANDGCAGASLLATTIGERQGDPSIHLIVPNGGERFRAGERTTIRWEGIPPESPVRLEYSTDAGKNWITIAPMTQGGRFDWTVPATPSRRCLARVTEITDGGPSIPPIIGDRSWRNSSIRSLALSPDGSQVITASDQGEPITIWNTMTGLVVMTLPKGDRVDPGQRTFYAGFSPDARRVITASQRRSIGSVSDVERVVELWDAATGRRIAHFNGTLTNGSTPFDDETGSIPERAGPPPVSPFDARGLIFIAVVDNLPTLFDANDGRAIRQFDAPPGTVRSIRFSPDGRIIATAGSDGALRLFRTATGQQTRRLGLQGAVEQIEFSPDGRLIGASCGDDRVHLFDVRTGRGKGNVPAATRGKDSPPNSFIFSPGGDRMLVWQWDRMAPTLYSLPRGYMIHAFAAEIDEGESHPRRNVGMSFSPDGALLAFTGSTRSERRDYAVKVVDVSTGAILARTVVGEASRDARYALFTPNGDAAVTAGQGVPIVQPLGGRPVQQDRSDNLWSIVDARPVAIDVDFGPHPVGHSADSIVTTLIGNRGTDTLFVEVLRLAGANESDFFIVAAPEEAAIPPMESARAELRFRPSAPGRRSAILEITAGGRTLQRKLLGEGVEPRLRLAHQAIDFGDVRVGTARDTLIPLQLQNIGSVPLTIEEIQMMGPDSASFIICDEDESRIIEPGGFGAMEFRYFPRVTGRRSTRLVVRSDDGSSETIDLYGRGFIPEPERLWRDPTTFRTISIPNAVIPPKGSVVTGVYDLIGLMVAYAPSDNLMVIGGGAAPLPDDWKGVNEQMYGAWSLGLKGGFELLNRLDVVAGFQYGMSMYDRQETKGIESRIDAATPYGALSYGDDDCRVSITAGYAFKRHRVLESDSVIREFRRDAPMIGLGADYRFASRWKVCAEALSMRTLGYIPIATTIRFFGDTWALDVGVGYLGVGADAPEIPVAPVVSWVAVW